MLIVVVVVVDFVIAAFVLAVAAFVSCDSHPMPYVWRENELEEPTALFRSR